VPVRKRLRLVHIDYAAAGAYFVTVCVEGKECVLGRVVGARVELSALGVIVARQINDIPKRFSAEMDCMVVMPNHVHVVVFQREQDVQLGTIVGSFKAGSTREINAMRRTVGQRFWQRGYFDHIVRNDADLQRVREYIATNPMRWSAG
jgi:REP element-mobilizing transposase RayT